METTEAETTQERYLSTGLKYVLDQVRTQMEIRLLYATTNTSVCNDNYI